MLNNKNNLDFQNVQKDSTFAQNNLCLEKASICTYTDYIKAFDDFTKIFNMAVWTLIREGNIKVDTTLIVNKTDLSNLATKNDLSNTAWKSDITTLAEKLDLDLICKKKDLENLPGKSDFAKLAKKLDLASAYKTSKLSNF